MPKTYQEVYELIKNSNRSVYMPIFYHLGWCEWLPVDKTQYLLHLQSVMQRNPNNYPFPCYFEVEFDGDMVIHPKMENR